MGRQGGRRKVRGWMDGWMIDKSSIWIFF
jgi:hypothetical protein